MSWQIVDRRMSTRGFPRKLKVVEAGIAVSSRLDRGGINERVQFKNYEGTEITEITEMSNCIKLA